METSHVKEHTLVGEWLYSIIKIQMQKSLRDIGVSEVKCKNFIFYLNILCYT